MSADDSDSIDLTVVVPVRSEGVEFEQILEAYGAEFDQLGVSHEFVFVLDGTPKELFEDLGQRRPANRSIRLIQFNQPFGESIALAAGFKIARGRVVLSLPSYIQTDPKDVHHVLEAISERGADVVTCWRKPRVDPLLNRLQSYLFNVVMRMLTGVRVHDLNCLQRAMRRRVFKEVTVQGDMYRFLPVLAHRAGYEVVEVAVRHVKEIGRFGVFGVGVYLRRILDIAALLFLTRFTRKPLRFFGLAGGSIFLIGLTICVFLFIQFVLGGDNEATRLKNRATLVMGVLLLVLGVQTFFIGLVAEIIIFTQGRNLKDYKVGRIAEGVGPPEPSTAAEGRSHADNQSGVGSDGRGGGPGHATRESGVGVPERPAARRREAAGE